VADAAITSSGPAIRSLRIEYFRGIERLEWKPAAGLNLIVGPGDSCKSTVLEAISVVLARAEHRHHLKRLAKLKSSSRRRACPIRSASVLWARPAFLARRASDLPLEPTSIRSASDRLGYGNPASGGSRTRRSNLSAPGSAGPRRFKLPVTVARVRASGRKLEPAIVRLET
jgi:hypothetical protein